jgi:DNA-directed RNA polymerase specialized sigma subunit
MAFATNGSDPEPRKGRNIYAEELPPYRFIREVLRHYLTFRDIATGTTVSSNQIGKQDHVLEHSYLVDNGDGTTRKCTLAISFWDLHRGILELAPRKREALFYNVILDQKQKDVAARMGITTVSVGQYVDAATKQLVKYHFPELVNENGEYEE